MDRESIYRRGVAGIQELQSEALERAEEFLGESAKAAKATTAADWSLAAKNAVSVAVSCETILKIRNGGGR